ncbi:hypothetical protein DPMN_101038 [Dreissena polymorpha]|uniref:Uncharacterized protein n=1 Tax=Dreissena polymorpha TaxID=45954 RepID=A0A9D4LIK0_DREPO|nr:hypothetical protein DPMN_101038 [Dreissena polymorpha]
MSISEKCGRGNTWIESRDFDTTLTVHVSFKPSLCVLLFYRKYCNNCNGMIQMYMDHEQSSKRMTKPYMGHITWLGKKPYKPTRTVIAGKSPAIRIVAKMGHITYT